MYICNHSFLIFYYIYLSVCAHVHMTASAFRGQSCPIPLELELQVVMSRLTRVLEFKINSVRAVHTLIH